METYIALVHYPVLNRRGERICSAITNLDLHDIARTATTYGVSSFFVVTPSKEQQALAKRVMAHWIEGAGARFNPDRRRAFGRVKLVAGLQDIIAHIPHDREDVMILATSARDIPGCVSWEKLEKMVYKSQFKCILLLFGTASGLHDDCLEWCDGVICPIRGAGDYNHLSVRSAVAITLDRISRFRRQ